MGFGLPRIVMPFSLMMWLATIAGALSKVFKFTPTFTIQSVTYAGKHHYYSSYVSGTMLPV